MVIRTLLAIDGGEPTFATKPPSWPPADDDVLWAMQAAFADGSWGRYEGPHSRCLSELLAATHQVPHVLLCCSGTVAVELALRGLNVRPEDEVLLAGYDFPGNFRAIEAVGARPVLVDIDPATWTLDPGALEESASDRTVAIVVSHLHGGLAAMPEICQIARRRGWGVVEDACQASGAIVAGRPAGSWGDVGVLSFGGSKLLTAGRGGALLVREESVFQRAKIFCERGNHAFPMSELQAAVLHPQMIKLDKYNARRLANVERLLDAIGDLPALQPVRIAEGDSRPSFYKLAWHFESEAAAGVSRPRFLAAMQAEGVAIDAGFRGFFRRSGRRCRQVGTLSASRRAAQQTVILHHPVLLEANETIDRLAAAMRKVVEGIR